MPSLTAASAATPIAATQAMPLRLREACSGDAAFICATWKQNYWASSPWGSRMPWQVFRRSHEPILQRLLSRSLAIVACDAEHEAEIFGYLVCEPDAATPAVHFGYVKPTFRRAGIFRALLLASGLPPDLTGVDVTHATQIWLSSLCTKFPGSCVNPYRWITE